MSKVPENFVRILLDHCVSRKFGRLLIGHSAATAGSMGWAGLSNGKLMAAAAAEGFDALITVDRSLRHQQDTGSLPLPVILINAVVNTTEAIAPMAPEVLRFLNQKLQPRVYFVGGIPK